MIFGIGFARCMFSASALRLTVACFNQRAITEYEKTGFRERFSFIRETTKDRIDFLVMHLEVC